MNDISFELKRGEVLGIVGLLGAGKTEIAKALFGVYGKGNDKLTGNIWFNGKNARYASPVEAVNAGIGYISEDRGGEGLQVNQAIDFNISLAALKHMEVNAIAAVVIGGASMSGGEGSVVGTIVGALILTIISNAMNLMSVNAYLQQVVMGLIIIMAILFDMVRKGYIFRKPDEE